MDEQGYKLVMVPASRVKEVPVEGRRDAVILGPDGGEPSVGFFRVVGDVDKDWTVWVSQAMYSRIVVAEPGEETGGR